MSRIFSAEEIQDLEGGILELGQLAELLASHEALRQQVADYEEWGKDVRTLTRKIDIAFNGEEGAAKQASLCDLVGQAEQIGMLSRLQIGPKIFSFHSFTDWVNKAKSRFEAHGFPSIATICIDQKGRILLRGLHFQIARDEDAFPVDVFLVKPVAEL